MKLFTNISELRTVSDAGTLKNAALVEDDGIIQWVGHPSFVPADFAAAETIDCGNRAVLPGWVDSHTHMIFDGNRAEEFEARMAGSDYAAGGIAVTMEATRSAGAQRLEQLLVERISAGHAGGTTTFETKTGYGLNTESELEAAQVAARHADDVTFLGAHLVPPGADAEEYVSEVVGPMLEHVGPHVSWIDVFCERGAFNEEQSRRVLEAGKKAGLGLRVHGNQLGDGPGVQLAVALGAASVDHVNYLTDEDVQALASSDTVATMLPACDLSTRQPLVEARRLIDAGATVAIAYNLNPGTSFTSSMNYCVTTAVLQQYMSLDEAIEAATLGGAKALRRHAVTSEGATSDGATSGLDAQGRPAKGQLIVGAACDLHILDAENAINLAYRPGMPMTYQTWRAGEKVFG